MLLWMVYYVILSVRTKLPQLKFCNLILEDFALLIRARRSVRYLQQKKWINPPITSSIFGMTIGPDGSLISSAIFQLISSISSASTVSCKSRLLRELFFNFAAGEFFDLQTNTSAVKGHFFDHRNVFPFTNRESRSLGLLPKIRRYLTLFEIFWLLVRFVKKKKKFQMTKIW